MSRVGLSFPPALEQSHPERNFLSSIDLTKLKLHLTRFRYTITEITLLFVFFFSHFQAHSLTHSLTASVLIERVI